MGARRVYFEAIFQVLPFHRFACSWVSFLCFQRRFHGFSLILKSFLVSLSKWTERLALESSNDNNNNNSNNNNCLFTNP